jgi:hypothetical protein
VGASNIEQKVSNGVDLNICGYTVIESLFDCYAMSRVFVD